MEQLELDLYPLRMFDRNGVEITPGCNINSYATGPGFPGRVEGLERDGWGNWVVLTLWVGGHEHRSLYRNPATLEVVR